MEDIIMERDRLMLSLDTDMEAMDTAMDMEDIIMERDLLMLSPDTAMEAMVMAVDMEVITMESDQLMLSLVMDTVVGMDTVMDMATMVNFLYIEISMFNYSNDKTDYD